MNQRKKLLCLLAILFLGLISPLWQIPSVKANPTWLTGWSYRSPCVITHATGAGTLYPIYSNVYRGTGTNNGNKVYLQNHNASTFPNDLNFTDNDEVTPLDYWIESYNTTWAGVWTEVVDNLTSVDQTIYLYYGKSGLTTTSNGTKTFLLFNNFETTTDGWTAYKTGTISSSTAYAKHNTHSLKCVDASASDDGGQKVPSPELTNAYTIIFWVYPTVTDKWIQNAFFDGAILVENIYFNTAGQMGAVTAGDLGTYSAGQWYKMEVQFFSSTDKNKVWVNNVYKGEFAADNNGGTSIDKMLSISSTANTNTWYLDGIIIRKYVSTEPFPAWGSEETLGYALNLRVKDWGMTDSISGATVYKDTATLISNGGGWANWTSVSGTVAIKVKYYGFWVNGTFSITVSSDTTLDVKCKLYDVTITAKPNNQVGVLSGVNVTAYNNTGASSGKIKSDTTSSVTGQVTLTNLPNATLRFIMRVKSDWSVIAANTTVAVTSDGQSSSITADQNYATATLSFSYEAIIWISSLTVLSLLAVSSFMVRKKLKKKNGG